MDVISDEHLPLTPRRPLVGLAWVFSAGCAWPAAYVEISPAWLAAIAALMISSALLFYRRSISQVFLWPAVFFVGAFHGAKAVPEAVPSDLIRWLAPKYGHVQVAGRIADVPILHATGETNREWRFCLQAESAHYLGEGWRRVRGSLFVRLPVLAAWPSPAYGDRVVIKGPVSRRRDRQDYLLMKVLPAPDNFKRLALGGRSWVRGCLAWRIKAARTLEMGVEHLRDEVAIIRAMLLGMREEVSADVRERFWMTGTMHVFAVSGLHVGIVAFLGLALIRAAGVGRRGEIFALAPLMAAYVAATGLAPSAVRAALMTGAYVAGPLFRRRPDAPSALGAAALVILSVDARQIFDPGFLCSFMVVAGLMLFTPPLMRPRRMAFAADTWRVAAPPFWERAVRTGTRQLLRLLIFSFAAWLSSAPLTARWGHLFAPVALIGNVLAVPAAFMLVLTGALSLVTATVSTFFPQVFNHANGLFAWVFRTSIERLSEIPGMQINVRAPPVWVVGLVYMAIAGVLWLRGRPRWIALGAAAAVVGAAVAHTASDQRVTIHVLDSTRGNSILLEGPRLSTVLLDAGPRHLAYALVRYLKQQGVNRIEALVLTRADADRAGGLTELKRHFRIRRVLYPAATGRSPVMAKVLNEAREAGMELIPFGKNDHAFLPDGAELDAYHPDTAARYRRATDAALAIRWARGYAAVLVLGSSSPKLPNGIETAMRDPVATIAVVTATPESVLVAPMAGGTEDSGDLLRAVVGRLILSVRPRLILARGAPSPTVRLLEDAATDAPMGMTWRDANEPEGQRLRVGCPPGLRCRPGPPPISEVW